MPNLKIVVTPGVRCEMDVKRFYLPGTILHSECPHCGKSIEKDLGDRYLSYPETNVPLAIGFYHETPEDSDGHSKSHEWSEKVVLSITLTEVK